MAAPQQAPASPTATDQEPSAYMKNLVKETVKLHRILTRYLDADTIRLLFAEIFTNYNKMLESLLSKLDLFTSNGKNRSVPRVI